MDVDHLPGQLQQQQPGVGSHSIMPIQQHHGHQRDRLWVIPILYFYIYFILYYFIGWIRWLIHSRSKSLVWGRISQPFGYIAYYKKHYIISTAANASSTYYYYYILLFINPPFLQLTNNFIMPRLPREYELTVRQEPKQARMCGVGADRRPIDPPPIVQLRVIDPATRRMSSSPSSGGEDYDGYGRG